MTIWQGGEVWVGTRSDRPFPDWAGEVRSQDYGHLRYCVPGKGGGSICAVYDLRTGAKIKHYWIGDPADRAGVYLPEIPEPEPIYIPGIKPWGAGPTGGPLIHLAFEGALTADWITSMCAEAARLLVPAGFFLSTVRPNKFPGHYVSAIINVPLAWNGGGTVGVNNGRWDLRAPTDPHTVYVGSNAGSALRAGGILAHEVGHKFYLVHAVGGDPGNIMSAAFRPGASFTPDDMNRIIVQVARARTAWL